MDWLLLIASQPTGNAALRMRLWREMKARGAALLRDGVWLLPASDAARAVFEALARAVDSAGGQAHVVASSTALPQDRQWQVLFDRSGDYALLVDQIQKAQRAAAARARPSPALHADLGAQLDALRAVDFFPGAAQAQAAQALADLGRLIERRSERDEPQDVGGALLLRRPDDFRGRQWATRAQLWVDRVASAWLIRRFVDPQARFVWLKKPADKPRRALGFDFDGAEFAHVGGRVTFEVLRDSFGFGGDVALLRLGAIVHALDVGGTPVPEAAAVEALLRGLRRLHPDDDEFLGAAGSAFDGWYAAYSTDTADNGHSPQPAASARGRRALRQQREEAR